MDLVQLIYYLETDPEVKTFDFTSADERDSDRFWVVDVIRSNGTRINHQIGRGAGEGGEATQLQKDPSSDNASRLENRVFTDEDFEPHVKVSLRWLKPIGDRKSTRLNSSH